MTKVQDCDRKTWSTRIKQVYWTLRSALRSTPPSEQLLRLCDQPPILVVPHDFFDAWTRWRPLFDSYRDIRTYYFMRVRKSLEHDDEMRKTARWSDYLRREYPDAQLRFLVNTSTELERCSDRGLTGILANQNAFLDERIFSVDMTVQKTHAAVYNARPHPCKRFELASSLPDLALITYFASKADRHRFKRVQMSIPNAVALNWVDSPPVSKCTMTGYRRFFPHEVSRALNGARVGLCLSYHEGAMYAAGEYLLCGLPVVTTPSIGGRDTFFDERNSLTVEPHPEAVAEGVAELIARDFDPTGIREHTLSLMKPHRDRFLAAVRSILEEHGLDPADSPISLPNRLYRWQPLANAFRTAK